MPETVTASTSLSATSLAALRPSTRLLLLLARQELSSEQQAHAQELAHLIDDWDGFLFEAERLFVLPLCLHHLSGLQFGGLSPDLRERTRQRVLVLAARSLHLVAIQRALAREVLEPIAGRYLYFKGNALALRHYRQPAWRFCRDIDVLVPADRAVAVCEAAQQLGYQMYPDRMALSRRDLEAALYMRPVLSLLSPSGVLIEVHKQLDKSGRIYSTDELLASSEVLQAGDQGLRVLATHEHLPYVCLHHTRHQWSHLHWLTDLDAMLGDASCDLALARETAARRGLSSTLEASLALHRVCSARDPLQAAADLPECRDLLLACIRNIEGGSTIEHEMREERSAPDYAFPWQTTRMHRLREWVRMSLAPLKPSYRDYMVWPLPRQLHWVYYLLRPLRGLGRMLVARR